MKAQADYAKAMLARKFPAATTLLQRDRDARRRGAARVTERAGRRREGLLSEALANENIFKLYVRDGSGGNERLLVDPEAIKTADGKHYAIDYYAPSPDNRYVAYGISPAAPRKACCT